MSPNNNTLTEQEAASYFVLSMTKEVQDGWPNFYSMLKDFFKDNFELENEEMAVYDLVLASIAMDLQAVNNLFPKDQAGRIETWIMKCIDIEDLGQYAIGEVKKYGERFQRGIIDMPSGDDPISEITARLLQRWLGQNIQRFYVEMNGKKTTIISPVLISTVNTMLANLAGKWKRLKEDFEIVEGDISVNEIS